MDLPGVILTSLAKGLSSLAQRASSWSLTGLPSPAEQELQELERTMKWIHAELEDAEEKDIRDNSEQLRLQELRGVAYHAEDALAEYEYEVLHAKLEVRRQAMANRMGNKNDKVPLDLNYYHPKVSISIKLVRRVKDIRKRFKEITDAWDGLTFPGKVGKRRCIRKWKPMETTSSFQQAKIFGREDEQNRIIKWLLQEEESSGDTISVLGIVGMGGIGKTTLAQMSYNDARVQNHFNSRGWVYVSENFDVENIMKKICQSFCIDIGHSMSLNELDRKLKVNLNGKKFFLVLDDVWNQRSELWSSLKTLLNGAGVGKILVTTRNERVAQIMQTTSPIILEHLSFEDSLSLFKKIVYEGRDHNYLEIGKKIVEKCRGLPLAIKVLAGILRCEDEEEAWVELLESELWELEDERDEIFPALKLSYDHLPIELKQCFRYLCLFPKDSELYISEIVGQWMSHGFIQPKEEKMEEDVGNDYCNEFLHRSLLQYDGMFKSKEVFIMHDLVHDLAQSVAKDEYLLITTLKSHDTMSKTIRHLCLHTHYKTDIIDLEPLREAKHLRTLILSVGLRDRGGIQNMDVLPNLTCLRTLVLDAREPVELPDSIGCLKHLRYLKCQNLETIPASLYKLHFLQTLESNSHFKLSRDVGELINLRHLRGYQEDHLPREVLGLANLQTLPSIRLGTGSDDTGSEGWKMKDLKGLSNLRGGLSLRGVERVSWPDVIPPVACLKDTPGIRQLDLFWSSDDDAQEDVDERLAAQVLDSLQPHRNLKEMRIDWYPGVALPTWLGHELPALQKLIIRETPNVKSFVVPSFEKRKSDGFDFEWRSSFNPPAAAASSSTSTDNAVGRCFPSLELLSLYYMEELEEWQGAEERGFLPCLRCLEINYCPKLRTLPSLSHLDRLEIGGCPELRRLPSLSSLTELTLRDELSPEFLIDCCLPMLRTLEIINLLSQNLIFPNGGSLHSLEKLSLRVCRELSSVDGLGGVASLRHLEITYCGEMRSVEGLGSLASLHHLEINDCRELRSVEGLGGPASLRHLEIKNCPLLQISPDQRLPPNLKGVRLKESPGAEEWYQNQASGVSECQATA